MAESGQSPSLGMRMVLYGARGFESRPILLFQIEICIMSKKIEKIIFNDIEFVGSRWYNIEKNKKTSLFKTKINDGDFIFYCFVITKENEFETHMKIETFSEKEFHKLFKKYKILKCDNKNVKILEEKGGRLAESG